MSINWKMIVAGWNDRNKTTDTEEQMLRSLYDKYGNMEKCGDFLGVSKGSLRLRLVKYKIPIQCKGWGNKSHSALRGVAMHGKSAPEIASETGAGISNIHAYAKSHGIKLRLVRGQRRGMGRTP